MKRRFFLLQIILILVALVSCNNSVDDVFDVVDVSSTPFTMEFIEDGKLTLTTTGIKPEMKYSKDGGKTFTPVEFKGLMTYTCTINVSAGDKISLYSVRTVTDLLRIVCTSDCYIYGNMMSIVYSDDFTNKDTVPNLVFSNLFYNNNYIRNHASKALILPATNLGIGCYRYMFAHSSIQTAPQLPATTLSERCYEAMFKCSDLQEAPQLPATELAEYCYFEMFSGCEYLTTVPQQLPAKTLVEGCYHQMFDGCNSITTAPVLYGELLVDNCYRFMFRNCENLNSITCLAIDKAGSSIDPYTQDWVKNVSGSGVFIKSAKALPTLWLFDGPSCVPSGWIVESQ